MARARTERWGELRAMNCLEEVVAVRASALASETLDLSESWVTRATACTMAPSQARPSSRKAAAA